MARAKGAGAKVASVEVARAKVASAKVAKAKVAHPEVANANVSGAAEVAALPISRTELAPCPISDASPGRRVLPSWETRPRMEKKIVRFWAFPAAPALTALPLSSSSPG